MSPWPADRYPPPTADQIVELNVRLWNTDEKNISIQRSMGLNSFQLSMLTVPLPAGPLCRRCGEPLVWKTRSDRKSHLATCLACRHQEGASCFCDPCAYEQDEDYRQWQVEEAARRQQFFDEWEATVDADYVAATIRRLSPAQQLYLEGLRIHWGSSHLSWEGIALAVGAQAWRVGDWLKRFQALGLVRFNPETRKWHLHSAVERAERVLVP